MSALPEDPGHFVAWRARQHPELMTEPGVFAPRVDWGRYLDETLAQRLRAATSRSGCATCACAPTGIRRDDSGVVVTTDDGQVVVGDAVVLATGERAAGRRAGPPTALQRSAFFVPDPWAPGALDVVRRDAAGPGRRAAGRHRPDHGRRRALAHRARRSGPTAASTRSRGTASCPKRHAGRAPARRDPRDRRLGRTASRTTARRAAEHIARVQRATGDWRPAVDGLRTVVQALWQRLDESDRTEFLRDRRQRLGTAAPPDASRARPT